jgi:hypothetical protein
MDLPPDDDSLNLSGRGQFDHLSWKTYMQGDAASTEARVVSLHEMWHHELNNVSTYGCILSAYAQLARHAKSSRDKYRELLLDLAKRARTAHEVYATWYSVELLAEEMPREALIASHAPEYLEYFSEGAALVQNLERPFLRQQAFLCAMRLCFESSALAEKARTLELFDLAAIRDREFPTRRMRLLKEILPAGFFERELNAFLDQTSPPIGAIIQEACIAPTRAVRNGPAADQEDAATAELHRWLHQAVAALFAERGMPSNPYLYHLQFIEDTCAMLHEMCATDEPAYHQLIPNRTPLDNATNLLIQAENEVLHFRDAPLPATLYTLADIPAARRSSLSVGQPPHWFLCVRRPDQILAQHTFEEDDAAALRGLTEPLVFLRRRNASGTGAKCELVVIQSPEELAQVKSLVEVPALACISAISLAYGKWCDDWLPVIGKEFLCVILFDLSLSRTLRDGWQEYETIHYAKGTLSNGAARSSFLTFLGVRADKSCAVYIIPCTDMFEGAVVSFIRHRLSPERFIQNDQFLQELHDAVPVVVQHVLAEEYFFALNQIQYGSRRN